MFRDVKRIFWESYELFGRGSGEFFDSKAVRVSDKDVSQRLTTMILVGIEANLHDKSMPC